MIREIDKIKIKHLCHIWNTTPLTGTIAELIQLLGFELFQNVITFIFILHDLLNAVPSH
jgi:hypothetical protein